MNELLATLAPLPELTARHLWQEPEVIDFITEHWDKTTDRVLKARLSDTLLGMIEASKAHPEYGTQAGDAATLMNYLHIPLFGRNWQGVHLHGADLRYAILIGTNLQDADLTSSWLTQAQLQRVDLRRANLTDVHFGERPSIALEFSSCVSVP